MNPLKRTVLIAVVILVFNGFMLSAHAAQDLSAFDRSQNYDIYFQGYDGGTYVVRRARIVGSEKIIERDFLVIRDYVGLQVENKQGYILFESITAIFPSSVFNVSGEYHETYDKR